MTRTKKSSAKALNANEELLDTDPSGEDSDGVGDIIITPIDTISAEKRTNASWAAIRGAHKISKKTDRYQRKYKWANPLTLVRRCSGSPSVITTE